ncbi:hypothetical protein L7F22_042844 [Adiantum nelumboides]|nr:hypothetical protein [Adiantum nelumboides]
MPLDEQYNTFHKFVYAGDPSIDVANNIIGYGELAKANHIDSVYNLRQSEHRKRKAQRKAEKKEDQSDEEMHKEALQTKLTKEQKKYVGEYPLKKSEKEKGDNVEIQAKALDQGTPPLAVVDPKPCKLTVATKEGKKGALKGQQPKQGLKIATPHGQDSSLSADVPQEPCQGEQEKGKADVKEEEGAAVLPKQHINVKRLKRMKEVGVREVAFEWKLAIDEVKVRVHTGKGQLEKVSENKIALKRNAMKKKAKMHVEKGLEVKGPSDNALALVGSSKRPKFQVKRAKQSRASCIASTTMHRMKVGMWIAEGDKDKSSGGSDDGGDEDDGSSQDGGGDDESDDGSNGDANADDSGSDVSGDNDDNADGEDDARDDEDNNNGTNEEDSESVSEQDDAQDVSSDKDEVPPASILA